MPIRKIIIVGLMSAYLYMLTFDIFLNLFLRFPAPLICVPLIVFFPSKTFHFAFLKEVIVFFITNFLVYVIYAGDNKAFAVNFLTVMGCALYFIFFIGNDLQRLKLSVMIVIVFLFASSMVMLLDHYYHSTILNVRERLIGGFVLQSPSGIAAQIFTFGYQLAALTSFLFVYVFVYKKSLLMKVTVLIFCLTCIFLGMQRSVLVTFFVSGILFLVYYYKLRAVLIIGGGAIVGAFLYLVVLQNQGEGYNNILAKNERNANEDRGSLAIENLKVYTNYPYGLIFYGKKWKEVVRGNAVFGYEGITSHNAYMMFITYLGPFIGITILVLIYRKIVRIFRFALQNILLEEYALLISLCFAFLAASLNSLFHNAWLVNANGPTIFLYFAVLHCYKINLTTPSVIENPKN